MPIEEEIECLLWNIDVQTIQDYKHRKSFAIPYKKIGFPEFINASLNS